MSEQTTDHHRARDPVHDEIQRVRDCVNMFYGEGVFDPETTQMLVNLTYALHDVVDGKPVGTERALATEAFHRILQKNDAGGDLPF
jgi:hypothetical protein